MTLGWVRTSNFRPLMGWRVLDFRQNCSEICAYTVSSEKCSAVTLVSGDISFLGGLGLYRHWSSLAELYVAYSVTALRLTHAVH